MKKVAIIIVNWNGKKFLKNCFNAIYKQTYKNFDIYFVDNGSIDESSIYVRKKFPKVKIVQLDKNYGFARGNNEGIKKAFNEKKIEYIVCLNNDTIVDKNWLKELVKTAEKDDKIGAVGSKLLFFYNRDIINTMGIIPLKNGNALNLHKNEPTSNYKKEEKIFGPCAGSALYKRKILEKIGLFDERYFCYLEDVDLAHRINKDGFYCMNNPQSIVYHIHSATSSNNSDFKWFLIHRNSLLNCIKHYGIINYLIYPFITLSYYNKFKSNDKIGKQVKQISKLKTLKLMLKAYFSSILIAVGGKNEKKK